MYVHMEDSKSIVCYIISVHFNLHSISGNGGKSESSQYPKVPEAGNDILMKYSKQCMYTWHIQ